MKIKRLENGTLLVPQRVETENAIGDAMREVEPGNEEYQELLEQFEREQQRVERQEPSRAKEFDVPSEKFEDEKHH